MKNTSKITKCALMCAICAAVSMLSIPMPSGVPVTFQCFAVSLCGYLLGRKWGLFVILIYILLGLCGLPVFSGMRGGVGVITSLSGGFIIGFLPLVLMCGKGRGAGHLLQGFLGVVLCHLCGIVQFSLLSGNGFFASAILVSLPYIVKDILLNLWAYFMAYKLEKRLNL